MNRLVFSSLALLAWLAASPADAGHERGRSRLAQGFATEQGRGSAPADRDRSAAPDAGISPGDAADIVRGATGARVLGVAARRSGGRLVYRVKVLDAGTVRILLVDGRHGRLLR